MRYFLEVSYKGTHYAGFQVQQNANTVQAELEKALSTLFQAPFALTGSSRTDAGVHAYQNYFHTDVEKPIEPKHLYNINAMLPADIALLAATKVSDTAHCRFDALSRQYKYYIYHRKNPFLKDVAWYYPYPVDLKTLNSAAAIISANNSFLSYAKRNSQVKTHTCTILQSEWQLEGECMVYTVKANRFLRGMVRALVATTLKVGRQRLSLDQLRSSFTENPSFVDFSAPAHGLFLTEVEYPGHILQTA